MLKMIDRKMVVVGLTFTAVMLSAGAVDAQPFYQAPAFKSQRYGSSTSQPLGKNATITTINGKTFPAYPTVGLNVNPYINRVQTPVNQVSPQVSLFIYNPYTPPVNNLTYPFSTPNYPTPYIPNIPPTMVPIYPTYPGPGLYPNYNPYGFNPYNSNPNWLVNNQGFNPYTNPFGNQFMFSPNSNPFGLVNVPMNNPFGNFNNPYGFGPLTNPFAMVNFQPNNPFPINNQFINPMMNQFANPMMNPVAPPRNNIFVNQFGF